MTMVAVAPISAMAAPKYKKIEVTEKSYRPSYSTGKMVLSSESVVKYNKNGAVIGENFKLYNEDETGKRKIDNNETWNYTSDGDLKKYTNKIYLDDKKPKKKKKKYAYPVEKKGKKTIYSDGSYSVFQGTKNGVSTTKEYNKKGKLVCTRTIKLVVTGNVEELVIKKDGKTTYEHEKNKDKLVYRKNYNDEGTLLNEVQNDKNGNTVLNRHYNTDGTVSFETTYEYTYEGSVKVSSVDINTTYNKRDGSVSTSKKENTYYTSGSAKGELKTSTNYTDVDGSYEKGRTTSYTYKYDKKGYMTERLEKDADTDKVKMKTVYTYKTLK